MCRFKLRKRALIHFFGFDEPRLNMLQVTDIYRYRSAHGQAPDADVEDAVLPIATGRLISGQCVAPWSQG